MRTYLSPRHDMLRTHPEGLQLDESWNRLTHSPSTLRPSTNHPELLQLQLSSILRPSWAQMQTLEPSPSPDPVESHQSSNSRFVKFCPRLPLELWDKTIDETLSESDPWDHRQHILRQLSLVCRAWLPRSQYWLFKRIELASHDYATRFERLLAENPSIGRNVQQLSMCIMYPFQLQSQEEPRSWTGVIQDITRRLPNMIAFELSPGHIVHLSPLQHSNIRELRLRHAKFHSLKSLRSCLQSMPNLEQLELSMAEYGGAEDGTDDETDILQSDESTPSGLSIVPHLTCLKVTAASPLLAIEVIDMLTQRPTPPIRELELGHLPDQCLQTNLDWFRNIAPNIEHLRVALSADSDHRDIGM